LSQAYYAQKNAQPVAAAEDDLRKDFDEAGLLDGSFQNDDFPFTEQEREQSRLPGTNIDRHYHDLKVALFYDGPVHRKKRQGDKDERIDKILLARGYAIGRFPYRPPITVKRRFEIVKEAAKILLECGYRKRQFKFSYEWGTE